MGTEGELLLLDLLLQYGYDAKKNDDFDKRYEYDVYIVEPFISFEVKYDIMSAKTGNVCLEYHNSKKNEPSGIMRSTADFWVHIVDEGDEPVLYLANRLALLESMDTIKPFKKIVAGGDKNSNMLIYKQADMLGGPLVMLTKSILEKLIGELR